MAAILEIYLVRHAVAAERGPKYPDDRLRPLTPEGVKRFRESVKGLGEFGFSEADLRKIERDNALALLPRWR